LLEPEPRRDEADPGPAQLRRSPESDGEQEVVSPGQRTIARPAACEGVGLHTGALVHARMLPADPDTGIVFVRTDLPGRPRIAATTQNRIAHPRRTAIQSNGAEVHTVEHMISAAVGIGIDNLVIELD